MTESAEELYENAPCGYVSTTPDGRIVRINQTLVTWLESDRSELLGKSFSESLTIGGKILYQTHFIPLLLMHGDVREIALDLVSKRGKVIPTFMSAVQKSAVNSPVITRITIFNATERRSYERELLAARNRAEQISSELSRVNAELTSSNRALLKANEELGQFAYAASHDLQEPLRTMTAFAQLLQHRYRNADPEAELFAQTIVNGARRMQTLICDLLALSQAQGSDLVLRPTNLEYPIQFALSNLETAISESQATVNYDNLPTIRLDAARMAQVFQNLVSNAIKYRKPSEPPVITISAHSQGPKAWLISVEDNGEGFASHFAEQIFTAFKRLHGSDVPGTGVGLALCRKIIDAHGGRIWAESEVGVGSRFYFTLPS